jgi:hypothetical protein
MKESGPAFSVMGAYPCARARVLVRRVIASLAEWWKDGRYDRRLLVNKLQDSITAEQRHVSKSIPRQCGDAVSLPKRPNEGAKGVGMNGRCQSRRQGDRASSRAEPAGLTCRRREWGERGIVMMARC